jgi:hypothetical protein
MLEMFFLYDWCSAKRKLVPLLFSVFLNDLEDYFKNLAGCPLEIIKDILEANLHMSQYRMPYGNQQMYNKVFSPMKNK